MEEINDRASNVYASWLTINRECTNRCRWCYAQDTKFKGSRTMSFELAGKLVSLLSSLSIKRVMLIGGEPAIYPHIRELVRLLKSNSMEPIIITNARRFSNRDFAANLAEDGLREASVSVKAIDREKYIEYTGVDGFGEFIAGMKNMKELGFYRSCSVTMTKSTMPYIETILSAIMDMGADFISVEFGHPYFVGNKICGEEIPSPYETRDAFIRATYHMRDKKAKYCISPAIPLCMLPADLLQEHKEKKTIISGCHMRSASGLIFSEEGKVLPCNTLLDYPLGSYGTDFSTPEEFRNFWNSDLLGRFFDSTNYYPSIVCSECEDWEICCGGCVINWLYFDPQKFIMKGGEMECYQATQVQKQL